MTYSGYLTDVPGILVGHYTDEENKTGCTAIICKNGAVCGSDVRGGAPGTRETDLTKPGKMVERAHCVMLSGGSAFGLAAASGAMDQLEEMGIGLDTGAAKVPIVLSAVIYDLGFGSAKVRPTAEDGKKAVLAASSTENRQGSVGAGTGATVGKALGPMHMMRSGLGSATVKTGKGTIVSAMVVCNAVGDIYDGKEILLGLQKDGRFLDTEKLFMNSFDVSGLLSKAEIADLTGKNTTIGVIATNAKLTKAEVNKVAEVAHNGFARAIRPVHTMNDGDTIFALATGEAEGDSVDTIAVCAQEAMRQSILNIPNVLLSK
ncbi:MAG: P1 family peptidase [Christensenellaceae bacterium]|nr:P1 family peptidase [Christensenellaceae bacterium]